MFFIHLLFWFPVRLIFLERKHTGQDVIVAMPNRNGLILHSRQFILVDGFVMFKDEAAWYDLGVLDIQKTKLKSGLTLIKVPMKTESVTVLSMIRAGSRDEFEGKWGVAHFLEHFVFKGTKKYPKVNDVTKVIDGIGGKMNAFTWNSFTGFWVKVANSHLEKGLDVVSQLVCEPLLPEGEIKKERGTIIQEIKMYEDEPMHKSVDVFEDLAFPDSGIGRPVIGFEETVGATTVADLRAFRDRWYYPENMVVVVAGDYSQIKDIDGVVEESFGVVSQGKEVEREGYGEVFSQKQPRVKVFKKETEQAHLVMGVRTFAHGDRRDATLEVVNQILGGNMSSRLWNEVREKRGLAYYVKSGNFGHSDNGVSYARAGVKLDKVDEAIKVIKEELLKVAEDGVTKEELMMGKEGIKGGFKLDIEDSQAVANLIGTDWALMDGKVRGVEEIIGKINEVSQEDIKSLAVELFKEEQLNLAVVGDFDEDKLKEWL